MQNFLFSGFYWMKNKCLLLSTFCNFKPHWPIHPKSKNVCGFCFSVQKNLRKKCVNSHDKISRQKCVNHRISIFSFTKKGIHLLTALCQAYTIIYCVFPTILKWNVRSETRNLSCKTCQLTLVFEYACWPFLNPLQNW